MCMLVSYLTLFVKYLEVQCKRPQACLLRAASVLSRLSLARLSKSSISMEGRLGNEGGGAGVSVGGVGCSVGAGEGSEDFVFIGRMLYINERDLCCMSLKVVSTVLPRVQKASEYSPALPSETLPFDDTNVFPMVLKRREHRAKAHYACELECGTHVKVK